MHTRILGIMLIAVIPVFGAGCSKEASFNNDISPILIANCQVCHTGSGEGIMKSGFSVQDYESLLKGTKYGPVVIPGSSASSTLYRLISQHSNPEIQMPPHHDKSLAEGRLDPLTPEQVKTFKNWIDQGAKNN